MSEFDLIKRKIKLYNQTLLIHIIFELLNATQKVKDKTFPFWRILVLLKWVYQYATDYGLKKNPTHNDLHELILLVEKFESSYSGVNFKAEDGINKSFRILAYQQFSYQDTYSQILISRQLSLYNGITNKFNFNAVFEKRTGMSIEKFLMYCHFTNLYFSFEISENNKHYEGILYDDYFDLFRVVFPNDKVEYFLNLLSIYSANDLMGLHKMDNEILQLYETNFLITKPFHYFNGKFRIAHKAVFLQTLSHFIYSFLKESESNFTTAFGGSLEKYVELGLKEINKKYINETVLKEKYKQTKVVDYIAEDNILIEVKATELKPRSGVSRDETTMAGDMKSSVVKAYTQMLSIANLINNNEVWYGMVITYKEMYLGFGKDAWKDFLKQPIEAFLKKEQINISILPPTNLFFVSISDWDRIVQAIKSNKSNSIKEILLDAQRLNSNGSFITDIFMMEQVLKEKFYVPQNNLSYLSKEDEIINTYYNR